MVDVVRGLPPFAARPPTPPRERNDTITKLTKDNNAYFNDLVQQAVLDSPNDSPSSSGDYFGASSDRGSKRVVFSPWTKYHKPLSLNSKNTASDGNIRSLPPSRYCQSSKSILKPYIEPTITPDNEEPLAFGHGDIPTMLRSAAQHLASPLRSSRLDAYMTILGCLSAYSDVPDAQALTERLIELTEYIRRDVSARMKATGAADTQLATQALKLLITVLHTGTLKNSIPEEFSSHIIDRSIAAIEDPETPKILVSHYMQLLVKQDFPAQVMSNDRVGRLLSALSKVETRVNGSSVIGHRLMIYQRLLTQSKALMKLRAADWMEHLIMGMLATLKDTRSRAIAFGLEAGLGLGTTSTVSQACINIFNRESPEGVKVVDFLAMRLREMVKVKDDGIHVPQIWSIAILFLRSRRRQIERWEHLKSWLVIMQQCFNSSDAQIKFQANIAWNRLIYAVSPDSTTAPSLMKTLRQPIIAQLDRKISDKQSKHAKQIARSAYCNLLYYVFRPVPTFEQLDIYWEQSVAQIIAGSFSTSTSDTNYACEILAALFGSRAPKVWNENRANAGGPTKPEDLPFLDPRWIRRRASTILTTLEKLLDHADWQLDTAQEASIVLAWRAFVAAVGEAGNKEVKVSMDSMTAVAHILTTTKRFWERTLKHPKTAGGGDLSNDLRKFDILIGEAVAMIGIMPFTEKRLIQNSQDSFEAAETPSSRSIRQQGHLNTPVLHLLYMIISSLGDSPISSAHRNTIRNLLQIAIQPATSRRSKLIILREVTRLLPSEDGPQSHVMVFLWQQIAESARSAIIAAVVIDSHNDGSQYAGHDYRDAVKILEAGMQQQSQDNLNHWLHLSDTLVGVVHREVGDGGVVLAFVEPLANALLRQNLSTSDDLLLTYTEILLKSTSWPQSHHVMERAHKALWGTSSASLKPQPLDPLNNVCTVVDTLLSAMYRQLESGPSATMVLFLARVTALVNVCPLLCKVTLLKRIQNGLSHWIEDAKILISPVRSGIVNEIRTETKKLWAAVTRAIEQLPEAKNTVLTNIQVLVTCGLRSRHQSILNQSIRSWNSTFGNAEFLEYQDDLRAALAKLKSVTEMQLPNFPEEDVEAMSSPIEFVDSQDDGDDVRDTPLRGFGKPGAPRGITTPKPLAHSLPRFSASSGRTSPRNTAEKPKSRTPPTARLRHNDSQVHFAAIESSSPLAPDVIDSQLLTERQKEVKERQERDTAAIFPGIRSSPISKSRAGEKRSPLKLVLSGIYSTHAELDADDEISPVLPPNDALVKDILGSSPTPRSSRRVILDLGSDFEPPSSPPAAPSIVTVDQHFDNVPMSIEILQDQNQFLPIEEELPLPHEELVSITNDGHVASGEQPENTINHTGLEMEASPLEKDCQSDSYSLPSPGVAVDDMPSESIAEYLGAENNVDYNATSAADLPSNLQETSEVRVPPTSDIPVETLYTPAPAPNAIQAPDDDPAPGVDEVSRILDSFGDVSTSFYSNEDDQIAAQLVSDLERASQQVSPQKNDLYESKSEAKTGGEKRKNVSESLRKSKRTKGLPFSKSIEVVVETRKPGDINDYAIIDSRPAVNLFSTLPQEIKQERSPSPPSNVEGVAKAHQPTTDSIRRTRSSAATVTASQKPLPFSKRNQIAAAKVKKETKGDTKNAATRTGNRRRSLRLAPTSTITPSVGTSSSAEHDSNAGIPMEEITLEHGFSESHYEGQLGSQDRSTDQEHDASPCEEVLASRPGNLDSRDLGVVVRGVAEARVTPPLENKPVHRRSKKRRMSKGWEAEHEQDEGWVEESLDEGEQYRKRLATDVVPVHDVVVQEEVNPRMPDVPRSSARGLLGSFRQLLGDIKQAILKPEEEREMVNLMFESVREIHEAGRRNVEA